MFNGCFPAVAAIAPSQNKEYIHLVQFDDPKQPRRQQPQVESKYGESISVKDITGHSPGKKPSKVIENEGGEPGIATEEDAVQVEAIAKDGSVGDGRVPRQPPSGRRKAPTNSKNETFDEWLRQRQPRDFLAEQV